MTGSEAPALAEIRDRIRAAAAQAQPLRIRGGGTKDFYGEALAGDVVDIGPLAGIVAYAPGELVITARAGTPLDEIEAALSEHDQMLAFEPPHHGAAATLGGIVATGFSGPRRAQAGAVRDFVLGVRIVDGTGEALAFGGQVIKNVAGFDVSRLMTGALGTLGVLTEISLKSLPRPRGESTRVIDCGGADALRLVNEWGGKPLPVSATCYVDNRLWVRLSGAPAAVTAAAPDIGGEEVDGTAFWPSIRDQTHAGRIRYAIATDGVEQTYLYRATPSAPFKPVLKTTFRDQFAPQFFTANNQKLYVASNIGRDKVAIVLVDPATGQEERVVYVRDDVDVAGLAWSRARKRASFINYQTWKNERRYLDPDAARLFGTLERRLPGYEVTVQSTTEDETRMIVAATNERTQGTRYLYDRKADRLTKLGETMPWLPEDRMAFTKPITYTSRDGLVINGYLTLPNGIEPRNLPVVMTR